MELKPLDVGTDLESDSICGETKNSITSYEKSLYDTKKINREME
jgi:hypothetical protein